MLVQVIKCFGQVMSPHHSIKCHPGESRCAGLRSLPPTSFDTLSIKKLDWPGKRTFTDIVTEGKNPSKKAGLDFTKSRPRVTRCAGFPRRASHKELTGRTIQQEHSLELRTVTDIATRRVKLEGEGQVTHTSVSEWAGVYWMYEAPAAELTAAVHTHTSTLVHQGPPCWHTLLQHQLVPWCKPGGAPELVSSVEEEEQLVRGIVYFCFAGGTEAVSHPETPPSCSFRSSSMKQLCFPFLEPF